jgi:membrane-associated phospholipid phosphatase
MLIVTAALALVLSSQGTTPTAASDPLPAQQQGAQPQPGASPDGGGPQRPGDPQPEAKEPPPPHTGIRALFGNLVQDIAHLPAAQNFYVAGIGGGLALAAHAADQTFNVRLRSHYDAVNTAFAPAKYFGDTPEQVVLSLGTYAYGRLFDQPKVSHLGMDLLQAQLLTELLVQPLKVATHRLRPDDSNHHSFPSGHAAITFAGATVIERHLGWRKSLLGYGIASYVAASRLHDNRHYLSDVVFGAAVGTVAGRTVVHYAADYWAVTPVTMPGGGIAIFATRRMP